MILDRRLQAFRPDLADAALEGKVEAARFVMGTLAYIDRPVIGLRPAPDMATGIDTELLLGETVTIFERQGGWCWVKATSDGYVGYLPEAAVSESKVEPTHIVLPQRSPLYPEPELRKPHVGMLSMGCRIRVAAQAETRGNRYVVLEDGTALYADHVRPIGAVGDGDYVSVAARFLETPYLWGGRSGLGIDCSGLVQLAMAMIGKSAPRDTDMQAEGLGEAIGQELLRRGDLVFWKGHVAIMEDPETIIHANGHTMTVAREGFAPAVQRIGYLYGQPTGFRRPKV